MEALNVKHSALDGVSVDLLSQAKDIGGVMDSLEAALRSKLQANWQGQASEAFDTAKKKFNEGMAELNTLLGEIGQLVSEVNHRYIDVDRQQANKYV